MPLFNKFYDHCRENFEAPVIWKFMADEIAKEKGFDSCDSAKLPILGMNLFGSVSLLISEPETVRDLFTNKNLCFDKNRRVDIIFK